MRFSLFPKDEQFFDLYGKMADEIEAALRLLEALLATDPPDLSQVDPIRNAEHRCDTLTHDAIVGVGATKRLSAVRWGVAGQIVWAWILTIPASATIGALCYVVARALER